MPKKSYRQAINEALRQEMERDHRVVLMGEDVAGGLGAPGEQDAWGGPLGVTKGLMPTFGRDRVLDTPITESGFIGAAVGVAAAGTGVALLLLGGDPYRYDRVSRDPDRPSLAGWIAPNGGGGVTLAGAF